MGRGEKGEGKVGCGLGEGVGACGQRSGRGSGGTRRGALGFTSNTSALSGMSASKFESDVGLFLSSVDKMQQAMQLFAEVEAREKKKVIRAFLSAATADAERRQIAEKLAEKAAKAAEEAAKESGTHTFYSQSSLPLTRLQLPPKVLNGFLY
eukprot:749314-Hanusia_phi.AAC.1